MPPDPIDEAQCGGREGDAPEPASDTPAAPNPNEAVLQEIMALHNKPAGSWQAAALTVVVSLGIFIAAGAVFWSWWLVAMLVPILAFHELGHYLAMKRFGYRNLRMFFIPLFGAAVSGRSFNVPGWRKAMVALMGPMPGIVLGGALGAAALALETPWLLEVSLLAIFLNALNLLPFLPLDGGWAMHAVVFSRHPMLEGAFRMAAIAALGLGALALGAVSLMILALLMLVALPATFRTARIAADLRRRGVPAVSPDAEQIPDETAQAIIEAIKERTTTPLPDKLVAQQALQIFETLNARPPSLAASLALIALHGGGFFLAVVMMAALAMIGGSMPGSPFAASPFAEALDIPCESVRLRPSADAAAPSDRQVILAVEAASRAEAEAAFEKLLPLLPGDVSLAALGPLVIASAPEAMAPDLQRLRPWPRRVELLDDPPELVIECLAPDERTARLLEEESGAYFALAALHLLPPWMPGDRRTPEERSAHQNARRTYARLQALDTQIRQEVFGEDWQRRSQEIRRSRDPEPMRRLSEEYWERFHEMAHARRAELKASDPTLDFALIDLYDGLPTDLQSEEQVAARTAIIRLLGRLSMAEGRPAPRSLDYAAWQGSVARTGRRLELSRVSFHRLPEGAASLCRWLCERGCDHLRLRALHRDLP